MADARDSTTGCRFTRFQLRTIDVEGARAFYARLFGHDRAEIFLLHEHARARGAVAHWLGRIEVADLDDTLRAFLHRGAMQLGPTVDLPGGGRLAIVRDTGGAVVGVASGAAPAEPSVDVVWHVLHTSDVRRSLRDYSELFAWYPTDALDLGDPTLGVYHRFAWARGGASVGAMVDVKSIEGAHTHWLHHFGVAALDPALDVVREAGGLVAAVVARPDGDRVAVCDDPWGAAFALRERR